MRKHLKIATFVVALGIGLLAIPGSANAGHGNACFGWNEFVDVKPRNADNDGWHRERVHNHADVNPSSTNILLDRSEPNDRFDEWNGHRTCSGGVIHMYYMWINHSPGFPCQAGDFCHYHVNEKCYADGPGGNPDSCWR